jgi:capsular polysaccharide biosynthesis protein
MSGQEARRTSRLLLLVIPTVVAAGCALLLSVLQDPVYEATTSVAVGARIVVDSDETTALSPAVPLSMEIELAESATVRQRVQADLGLSESPPSADASPLGDESGIEIAVRSAFAEEAALLADAYAVAYVDVRGELALEAVQSIEEQLASGESAADESELQRLFDETVVSIGSTSVIEWAATPQDPADPRPPRDVLLAGAAGLLVGLLAILVLDYRDRSLWTRRDVERKVGLDVLGVVPIPSGPTGDVPLDVDDVDLQIHADLLGAVLARAPGLNLLQVISLDGDPSGAGLAAAVALAARRSDLRVALIDVEVGAPELDRLLDLPSSPGLTDILDGAQPAEVVHLREGVAVYCAGSTNITRSETVLRPKFARLLGAMVGHYDLVVVNGSIGGSSLSDDAAATRTVCLVAVPEGAQGTAVAAKVRQLRGEGAKVLGAAFLTRPADANGGSGEEEVPAAELDRDTEQADERPDERLDADPDAEQPADERLDADPDAEQPADEPAG